MKISPDLSLSQLDDVINLAIEINLDGLVVTNTTLSREDCYALLQNWKKSNGARRTSIANKSTEFVQYIAQKTNHQIPMIGSGGIFNIPDVMEKMEAGAGLIQVWTAFIYLGPGLVRKLLRR